MKHIQIKSPTRVDLAGGTLDLWPLFNFVGGAKTVNLAIDVWTKAELRETGQELFILESPDVDLRKEYDSLESVLVDTDPKAILLQAQLRFWQPYLNPRQGFHLKTSSESPVGGGLGGSSSLTITIMKAFAQWCDYKFRDSHHMVEVAHNIEAQILNTPTGTQDYYPAISGGLNVLDFSFQGIGQKVYPVGASPLSTHFMLVYTGKAHHSGLNNFEVLKAAVVKDAKTMGALHDLKSIAEATEMTISQKNWEKLPQLFNQEFEARVRLCAEFSSPEIEKLQKLSIDNGALAVKICGAGGGGCVLVWCSPEKQEGVRSACQKAGFQVMGAKPVEPL